MRPIHELPIEELWQVICGPLDANPELWALLRLDVARFLELQRRARAEGKIPAGPTWRLVEPGDPAFDPDGPLPQRRLQSGEWLALLGERGTVVLLPANGREPEPPRPPRRPPGAPKKLTDTVLRRHVEDHPGRPGRTLETGWPSAPSEPARG